MAEHKLLKIARRVDVGLLELEDGTRISEAEYLGQVDEAVAAKTKNVHKVTPYATARPRNEGVNEVEDFGPDVPFLPPVFTGYTEDGGPVYGPEDDETDEPTKEEVKAAKKAEKDAAKVASKEKADADKKDAEEEAAKAKEAEEAEEAERAAKNDAAVNNDAGREAGEVLVESAEPVVVDEPEDEAKK